MGIGRIMIACVTFETYKISNPVEYYNTPEVHLIHYIKDSNSPGGKIYQEFFKETSRQITDYYHGRNEQSDILDYNRNVSDFPTMLGTVSEIIDSVFLENPKADVFVNISAGSSEYVAAATVASMMYGDNVHPFTVSTKKYTSDLSDIRGLYYTHEENPRPIGLTCETYSPKAIMKVPMNLPNERLVRGLRILDELNGSSMKARSREVIAALKGAGLWIRDDYEARDQKTRSMRDTTYFHRDFMDKWMSLGWVVKDEFTNRYRITDIGKRIIATYYLHGNVRNGTESFRSFTS
ncbi:MAG: DUF6293 family protein [Candidatus Methanomethylophilus sp.]|jgi:hypothetical protein|nr:DUF6293 family protein [Methanomethylophilus sp.]MCI2074822.1 DUF6293 family protein [Methanomethylophilus sp.]MCI2092258.1 DUF6293 family protein [Methanomethylophilus sp.]